MADFTDDLGPTLWIVNSVFTMVATVTVIGRLAARKVRRMAFGADDWIICIALLLNWAMFSLAARAQIHGMGKHISTLSPSQIKTFTKNLYFMQITYVPAPRP
ncbi:hypothetical protein N7509_013210 [Penicillium cosmopolitanum]|uniref:Rhodopsin domain-containing protein n=1 Tax=Penicillium cosmopolitanum TaxID=1131564 RepID=A0A9W9SFL6_9EURO|nr:uncharacterized protein N7509_013210 [Penicillium cosmopolitanum]KAJ5376324.1 hypothetical protein N7509_013210 [Penicillium cosmopolitanum]